MELKTIKDSLQNVQQFLKNTGSDQEAQILRSALGQLSRDRNEDVKEETLLCCKESKAQQATEDVYTGAKMLVRDHVSNHVSTCQARAGAVTVPPSYTAIRPE